MEMIKYYWYTFEDGYKCCVRGFSENELKVEIAKHGKVVRVVKA